MTGIKERNNFSHLRFPSATTEGEENDRNKRASRGLSSYTSIHTQQLELLSHTLLNLVTILTSQVNLCHLKSFLHIRQRIPPTCKKNNIKSNYAKVSSIYKYLFNILGFFFDELCFSHHQKLYMLFNTLLYRHAHFSQRLSTNHIFSHIRRFALRCI